MKHSRTLVATVLAVVVFLAVAVGAAMAASEWQQWVPRPHVLSTARTPMHGAAQPGWDRARTGAGRHQEGA